MVLADAINVPIKKSCPIFSAAQEGDKLTPAQLTDTIVTRETPTGIVGGGNTVFTLTYTPITGSESVYKNGILQNQGAGNDYTIVTDTITFNTAPLAGAILLVSYRR